MNNFSVKYCEGVLHPEWAVSWREKAIGLRGRRSGCIMFEFEEGSRPLFDMLGVKCSLLIVFISEDLKVLEKHELEPGFSFVRPEKSCKYVLEDSTFPNIEVGEKLKLVK
jgi:uncharacterized membrane protein (UPF0127 family)